MSRKLGFDARPVFQKPLDNQALGQPFKFILYIGALVRRTNGPYKNKSSKYASLVPTLGSYKAVQMQSKK